jgi:ornithine cyclodeaminase/alanine dehydrogenase-like protein (mu-crystallin family)
VLGARAESLAAELGDGAEVAPSLAHALASDTVATVTPGRSILFEDGSLRAGQHVSLMGADGSGKAEIAVGELFRARVFCDDWAQASHSGDLARAVASGLGRADVTQLGDVLAGTAPGRTRDDEITLFDSTGLAIQDLAIALAVYERRDALDPQTIRL